MFSLIPKRTDGDRFAGGLSVPLPDGWFSKVSFTLVSPDGRANLIVGSELLGEDIDLEEYAYGQGSLLRTEFPGFEEVVVLPATFLGRPAVRREFIWIPPDGEPVRQIQLYMVLDGRGYVGTATTTLEEFSDHELQLRALIEGARLERGAVMA